MLTDCGKVTLNVHKLCNRLRLWRPAIGFSPFGAATPLLSYSRYVIQESEPLRIESEFKPLTPYIAMLLDVGVRRGSQLPSPLILPRYHLPPKDHGRIFGDRRFHALRHKM